MSRGGTARADSVTSVSFSEHSVTDPPAPPPRPTDRPLIFKD